LADKLMHFDGLHPSTIIKDVKLLIESKYGVPAALQRLYLLKPLDDQKTLGQCGIANGTVVNFTVNLRKPLIYFYVSYYMRDSRGYQAENTEGIKNIEVKLTLDRAWELSIVYPSMEISSGDHVQSVTWNVDAKRDGTLFDYSSQREATYIYWDGL
jgi:hypothetical protein